MSNSVEGHVRHAVKALRNAGDPVRAEGMAGYFRKDAALRFFGIKTAQIRALETEQWSSTKNAQDLSTAIVFADRMIKRAELESKIYGFARLHRLRSQFDSSVLKKCTEWLRDDHCASWAAVDGLCHQVVSPLVKLLPVQLPGTQRWGKAKGLWLRRASVVVFVPFVRRGEYQDEGYDAVVRHLSNPEDLMHKAMGWVLREAGNADRGRLEEFLLEQRTAIPRTSVRYAIEKFSEKKRKEFLKLTSVSG